MFGDSYFGPSYWGNSYFGPAAPAAGGGSGGERHETSWGAAPSYIMRLVLLLLVLT